VARLTTRVPLFDMASCAGSPRILSDVRFPMLARTPARGMRSAGLYSLAPPFAPLVCVALARFGCRSFSLDRVDDVSSCITSDPVSIDYLER
jgi:hypothetical protein